MGRPVDWHPLATADPVPGSPYEVGVLARRYKRTAEAIETAASKLRSIASADGWVGKAAIEFRDQAQDVADSIERAHDRYNETGEALEQFKPDHEEAQSETAKALGDAQEAKSDEERFQRLYDAEAAKDEPDQTLLTRYQNRVTQARTDFSNAQTAMNNAVTSYQNSAQRAANRIHEISQKDGLKTNWKDRLASVLKVVADIAGLIAAVAGILALAVGWIPIIGQALAAVLGTIALIAGLVSLLANIGLLIMGEGSWTAVILDTIGVLTFGIGRLFTSASRFSAQAAKLGAWKKAMPRSNANWSGMRNWLGGKLPPVGTTPKRFDAGVLGDAFRGAYGGVLRDLRQVKFVWANRHAFPTTGAVFPQDAIAQFGTRFASEMRHASSLGKGHGALHTFFGNADLAADLTKIQNLAVTSGSPLRFANTAFTQSIISGAGWATGGGLAVYNTTQIGS